MATKYGFSAINDRFSPKYGNDFLTNLAQSTNNIITIARVKDILLDNSDKNKFDSLGEWNGLGIIQYESIDKRAQNISGFAKPIDSNIKKYPLKNELVYIIIAPNTDLGNNPYSINAYYINTINLWNHPHHNGYPDNSNELPPSQKKDYTQTQAGSVRRVTDNSTEIDLGKTFKERANIHPLLPFEGDAILEGRWGNSIRLGSTVKLTPNNWSSTGENGDPITIIRNGQGNQTQEGWIPIIENINNDNSSVYLTSTQNIPLEVVSTKDYASYTKGTAPTSPNKFLGQQIILNSGRLVFNSKNDHILLSSAKSINLNSLETINIDTTVLSVKANNIYLGENSDYTKNEPLMLGTQTTNLLKDLVQSLTTFMQIAAVATTNPCVQGAPATLPTINSAANDTLDILIRLNSALGNDESLKDCKLTSKRNYTV